MFPHFQAWYATFSNADKINSWLLCAQVLVAVFQVGTLGVIAWSTIIARTQQKDLRRQVDLLPEQLELTRRQIDIADRQATITLSALSESTRPLLVAFDADRTGTKWSFAIENQGAGAAVNVTWEILGSGVRQSLIPSILGSKSSTRLTVDEREFLQRGFSLHYWTIGGGDFETVVVFEDGIVICRYVDPRVVARLESKIG
jgi:hypothetical protein